MPRRGTAFAILIEASVLGAAVVALCTDHASARDLGRAALLTATWIAYAEATDQVERRIRRFLYYGKLQVRSNPTSA